MQQRVENTKFIVSESRPGSQDGSRSFGSREEETARIVEAFEEEKFVSDTSDLEVLFIVMAVWRQNIIELGCFKILNSRLLSSLPTLESRNTWTTATTTSTTTSTTPSGTTRSTRSTKTTKTSQTTTLTLSTVK